MKIKKELKILITVLATGFILRLIWIFFFSPQELVSDSLHYHRLAESVLSGKGYFFRNFYAFRPPGYSFFLAGVYSIFGVSTLAVKIVQAILGIATAFIIYLLTKKLSNSRTALIAMSFFAFYPQFIRYPGGIISETLFLFLFILCVYFFYKYIDTSSHKEGIVAGILLGLSALTREAALYFVVFIIIWMFLYRGKGNARNILKKSLLIFTCVILTIIPWTIRNYLVYPKFVLISTNSGTNFYHGNNPLATGGFDDHLMLPPGLKFPGHMTDDLPPREYHYLENEANEVAFKEGAQFILDNPVNTFRLAFRKMFILLRPPYYQIHFRDLFSLQQAMMLFWFVSYVFVLIAGTNGIFYAFRENWRKWILLFFWIILICAMHIAAFAMTRYRLPIIPFLIIFAAVAMNRWLAVRKSNKYQIK